VKAAGPLDRNCVAVTLLLHHLDDRDVRQTMVRQWSEEHEHMCSTFPPDARAYGKLFTPAGWNALADVMPAALADHDDDWLQRSLDVPGYWVDMYTRRSRSGDTQFANNKADAIRRFGIGEFNTAYVRALATVGLSRGLTEGTVYRAGTAAEPRQRCSELEGQPVSLQCLIDDHRCYFPQPREPVAVPIPFGPNCHHSVTLR
jgi:hypothetical protein